MAQKQQAGPTLTVPAAKIEFTAEDRQWIADRIQEILESGQLTLGKYGKAFEEKFAELCGVEHAIAVNSGTAALEISLRALDVEGKDVLVPANQALRAGAGDGTVAPTLAADIVAAARGGLEATRDMQATKGRASFLKERSVGHLDPGAMSSYLLIKTTCELLEDYS